MQTRFVAIVGGSGSGKTWLADALLEDLEGIATLLSLDAFYRDLSHLPVEQRGMVNFDDPRAIDWRGLEETMAALRDGAPGRAPRYDFSTHTRLSGGIAVPRMPVVLLEGLWLLHRRALRSWFHLSVFVDCEEQVRLARRLRRDTKERGRERASVIEQCARQVRPMHDRHVEPQRRWADAVVRSPVTPLERARLVACIRDPTVRSRR